MSSIGVNRSNSALPGKGKSGISQVLDAIGAPGRAVQRAVFTPIREIADAIDSDPESKFAIGELLGLSGTQGALFSDLTREQELFTRIPTPLKIVGTLASDMLIDPLNYVGVGVLAKAGKVANLGADATKALAAGVDAANTAADVNKIKGIATVNNVVNEAADVGQMIGRVGRRVNAKRLRADLLTSDLVGTADRAVEAGKLFRGGVASLAPETQAALGYKSNLVFKIPFTESAIAIPGTEKIGAAISVTGGRVFKGGFNALVTSIDPKYWIGEEAMVLRMAANADLQENIPDGMLRFYEKADGSWTASKYDAVKSLTDVSAGVRVADVPEAAVASSGWTAKLDSVAGLSDDEVKAAFPTVNVHRVEVPYELPKAFEAVQARRLKRAIAANEAGQILHETILNGRDAYGIKDIRLSLNQMHDLGASAWLEPSGKYREVVMKAIMDTRARLVGKDGSNWRVPVDVADAWVEDTIKVLDEHADEIKSLMSDPARFAAAKKKGDIGIMTMLGEQGKKAGDIRAAIAIEGSYLKAARLSQGILKTGSVTVADVDEAKDTAAAIETLFDDMRKYGKSRGMDMGDAAATAGKAKPKGPVSPEKKIAELIREAKGKPKRNYADPNDIAAQLLTGRLSPEEARTLLDSVGVDKTVVDAVMAPFAGGLDSVALRKAIDAQGAKIAGGADEIVKMLTEAGAAEDQVRFWQHVLTNGFDELFDGALPGEFIQGLLDGTRVDPADWVKLAQGPVLGPTDAVKPALNVTVTDSSGAKQVIKVVTDESELVPAIHAKTIADIAPGLGGASNPRDYAALKASEAVASRQAAREAAQKTVDDLAGTIAAADQRVLEAESMLSMVDDDVYAAYKKYFKSKANKTDPVMVDWVRKELGRKISRKDLQLQLFHLEDLDNAKIAKQALIRQQNSAAQVLANTPAGVTAEDLAGWEKKWTDAYDARRVDVESQVTNAWNKHLEAVDKANTKAAQNNAAAVSNLAERQKQMVEKVLGKWQMKAMSARQKATELATQHQVQQTEMGRLMAMEEALNNAAFAVGDQFDKFTAHLYRDIQAQHVDLLRRAQEAGVTLNTSGDADVVFMDAVMQIAEMNKEAADRLLGLSDEIDGFKTVADGGNTMLPKKFVDFVTAKQHATEFSKVTRLWRSAAILRPGFSNRNFIGAWINNVSQGIRYRDYEAAAFLAAGLKKNADVAGLLGEYGSKHGLNVNEVDEAFTVLVANSNLVGEMSHGVHGGTRLGNMMDRGQAWMERYSLAKQGYLRSGNRSKAMGAAIKDITVEDNVRLAQYLGLRRQGFSHVAAMDQTLGTHFNYLDSSMLDAKIRKWAPFWTYQSRNLGLQAQLMLSHPETTKAFWTAREDLRKDQDPNLPPWLAGFALPYGGTVMDFSGWAPAADLVRMGDFVSRFPSEPDKSVFALTSQFLGGPQFSAAQLLMNKDLFRGGSRIYKPGQGAAGDILQYALKSVGPVQQSLSAVDTFSGDQKPGTKVFNFLYSLGLSPNKKDYIPQ